MSETDSTAADAANKARNTPLEETLLAPPVFMTEEQLRAAHVGEYVPKSGQIQLVDYDQEWPRLFERVAERVRAVLGDRVLLLEHVGSTSVPGLAAKPRINLLLAVADSADEPAYVPALEAAGYVLHIREPGWNEHRMFKEADPASNLHVFSMGCQEIDRMLLFRNWLRSHPDDRQLYEHTKRELARREWKHTQHYADAKTAVVEEMLARAQGQGQEKQSEQGDG